MGEWWEREEAKKRVKGSTRQNINLYVNRAKAGGLEAILVVMLVGVAIKHQEVVFPINWGSVQIRKCNPWKLWTPVVKHSGGLVGGLWPPHFHFGKKNRRARGTREKKEGGSEWPVRHFFFYYYHSQNHCIPLSQRCRGILSDWRRKGPIDCWGLAPLSKR